MVYLLVQSPENVRIKLVLAQYSVKLLLVFLVIEFKDLFELLLLLVLLLDILHKFRYSISESLARLLDLNSIYDLQKRILFTHLLYESFIFYFGWVWKIVNKKIRTEFKDLKNKEVLFSLKKNRLLLVLNLAADIPSCIHLCNLLHELDTLKVFT